MPRSLSLPTSLCLALALAREAQALPVARDTGSHDGLVANLDVVRVGHDGGGDGNDNEHRDGGSTAREKTGAPPFRHTVAVVANLYHEGQNPALDTTPRVLQSSFFPSDEVFTFSAE